MSLEQLRELLTKTIHLHGIRIVSDEYAFRIFAKVTLILASQHKMTYNQIVILGDECRQASRLIKSQTIIEYNNAEEHGFVLH